VVNFHCHFSPLNPCAACPLVLYGFSLAYLFAPGTFDSTHVVDFVASLPDTAKYAGKFVLALPFTFHSLNGLRHLAWDMGKCASFSHFFLLGSNRSSTQCHSHDCERLLHLWLCRFGSYGCLNRRPRSICLRGPVLPSNRSFKMKLWLVSSKPVAFLSM